MAGRCGRVLGTLDHVIAGALRKERGLSVNRYATVTPISNTEELLFQVTTPLDFTVRVTAAYWNLIVTIKHPVMARLERDV
jgi:hypothetical protein